MLPERRAVVFDMDDTLYPYRRFVLSGFVAVARHLEQTRGVDRRAALRALLRTSRGADRGWELQACVAALGLPDEALPTLLAIMRDHQPALTLPRVVVDVLKRLRTGGWKIGVLTNGPRPIQERKASALGIAAHVDTVVFATEHGSGAGKPDPEPFAEVIARLGTPATGTVFVGDDEICDVVGAAGAGLSTVRCAVWQRDAPSSLADAIVTRWSRLPAIAETLLLEVARRHAA